MRNYADLRKKLKGPVYPILPAFNKDFSINYQTVASYVKFLNSHQVRTLMVTAGTSRFNLLTDAEIRKLNQVVVETNKNQATTVVANSMIGSTQRAIEFARQAEKIGADAILLYYPERYYNDERVFDYFQAVAARTKVGVLIHALPMRSAYAGISPTAQFSLKLCQRLAQIDNIIGMKEESGQEDHRYKLAVHLKDKLALIVSGGSMRRFLSCVLFGVDAYLVGIGSFVPKIEEDFYEAVSRSDYQTALKIVVKYEEAFFEVAFPMGWHIAMKGAMNLLGLMPVAERPPLQPADPQERQQLRRVMIKLGWLKK